MGHPPLPVELHAVTVRAGATTILREISLAVRGGEAIGLFGANGAGKTTLLRLIATLTPPASGEGRVFGVELTDPARFDVRPRIGMIGHVPGLYPELTLRENLLFVARVAGLEEAAADEALATVGLEGAASRVTADCSHGMQRRAEFARELMRRPDLLLLDEPHTALDPAAVDLVAHVVAGVVGRGGATVVVSHDRDRVAPLVSRSIGLEDGRVR
jgi:heme ABC exporter ATP-binding subunit CcmA